MVFICTIEMKCKKNQCDHYFNLLEFIIKQSVNIIRFFFDYLWKFRYIPSFV